MMKAGRQSRSTKESVVNSELLCRCCAGYVFLQGGNGIFLFTDFGNIKNLGNFLMAMPY